MPTETAQSLQPPIYSTFSVRPSWNPDRSIRPAGIVNGMRPASAPLPSPTLSTFPFPRFGEGPPPLPGPINWRWP
jgi:hypothetical protein